ncbi:hypothetical protein PM03_01910 [Thalassobacter stenotrophicus]|uniref:DUF3047 domain-containing protein n=1 Tax=Thalassobacter TaxID=266808 RepID=UPI00051D82CD|nr:MULTISPECIES: DUF3047 domain-containing protein [Thalassobacter]KGK80708.1 hypothetical protein PM03_01910 [Thalassobacter stenotrophicus]KGL02090.1 hypothetical protein PM04_05935 [Thalassobacter sp. 16PALIMAR09]
MRHSIIAALVACTLTLPAAATQIPFDGSWREQGFLRLFSNDYAQQGSALDIVSDGTVSLLWRAVPESLRGAQAASWTWTVQQSVPPTDLAQKGGDDRNIALYFVYTTAENAENVNPNRAARLLRDKNTTALVYVWGGDKTRGTVMQSPYHPGLRTLVRRGAGTGQHTETVDLASDYRAAFGTGPGVLIGVGVTADADDTDTFIRAQLSNLTLN